MNKNYDLASGTEFQQSAKNDCPSLRKKTSHTHSSSKIFKKTRGNKKKAKSGDLLLKTNLQKPGRYIEKNLYFITVTSLLAKKKTRKKCRNSPTYEKKNSKKYAE